MDAIAARMELFLFPSRPVPSDSLAIDGIDIRDHDPNSDISESSARLGFVRLA